eukprot:351634-Chlamydomonas_euryale.AAC.2
MTSVWRERARARARERGGLQAGAHSQQTPNRCAATDASIPGRSPSHVCSADAKPRPRQPCGMTSTGHQQSGSREAPRRTPQRRSLPPRGAHPLRSTTARRRRERRAAAVRPCAAQAAPPARPLQSPLETRQRRTCGVASAASRRAEADARPDRRPGAAARPARRPVARQRRSATAPARVLGRAWLGGSHGAAGRAAGPPGELHGDAAQLHCANGLGGLSRRADRPQPRPNALHARALPQCAHGRSGAADPRQHSLSNTGRGAMHVAWARGHACGTAGGALHVTRAAGPCM